MTSLILVLMLQAANTQFLVSTKAGLVNYVQGSATVKPATSVAPGTIVGTGPGGAVELLLNPGSYLRMAENTRVVFDKVELYDISVRLLEGSMVIEANGFNKELPLSVTTGNLKMEVIKDGIYLFADGKIVVVDGRIRDASNGLVYTKGFQVSDDQGYRAQKVKTFTTALELWSQQRDEAISQANLNVARSLRQVPNLPIDSFLDVWLFDRSFGSFIYMPGTRYRSPYGYSYLSVGQGNYYGGGSAASGGSNGGGFSNGGRSGDSAASSSSGGGGGGSSVGFSSAAPASTGASAPAPSAGAQAGAGGGHTATLGK